MKTLKKLFTLTLAVLMIMALAAPVAAAGENYTITVKGTAPGHIFEAYQIFAGNLDSAGILTEVTWGSGVDTTKTVAWGEGESAPKLTVLEALQTMTRYAEADSASDVASALNNATSSDALAFAEVVSKYLSNTKTDTGTQAGPTYTLSGLQAGYYLIKDQDGSLQGEKDESYTEFILSVSKNTEINPKSGHATVEKQVSNTGAFGSFGDWVTQSIGSKVFFNVKGTLSNELHYYDEYYYAFIDNMTSGLTYDVGSVTVTRMDANGGTDLIDASCYTVQVNAVENGTELKVTFENLLNATSGGNKLTINRSDNILLNYSATVNSNSLIGLDHPDKNQVFIQYSNNPNTDDLGETHEVDVDVYTFELDIKKVDAMNHEKVLANAEFILYRTISDVTTYAKAEKNEDGVYKVSEWVANQANATVFVTGTDGMLKVSGLKAGGFYVKETKAPAGYNLLPEPLEVWIQVNKDALASGTGEKVTASVGSASVSVNAGTGVVSATIENAAGTILPSTGGIGTTIFYAVGGILFCGAIILLVTKKRMGA